VEYLVTGHEQQERSAPALLPGPRSILKNLETLSERDQKIVFSLIKSIKGMETT
jgi:hypothetical protein